MDRRGFVKGTVAATLTCSLLEYVGAAAESGSALPSIDTALVRFLAAKRAETKALAQIHRLDLPAEVWRYFDALEQGQWPEARNRFAVLRRLIWSPGDKASVPPRPFGLWTPILETYGACGQFHSWNRELLAHFGGAIIDSIPAQSIYFGGTDPGRFIITALSQSRPAGESFYTITQNGLADRSYLSYLQIRYGDALHLPSHADFDHLVADYVVDAQRRQKLGQLKPGEEVRVVDNKVDVAGQVSVMTINGLLAKIIFDQNSQRSFYVEESFPLDWMYPHLVPHRLILKLHRQPVAELSQAVLDQDQQYWTRLVGQLIGNWLAPDTPIAEVCDFAHRMQRCHEAQQLCGDPKYSACSEAQRAYARLRSAIGGLYAWRLRQVQDSATQSRLARAADYAFRQAYALCPHSPEALFRYVNLLVFDHRLEDALALARTSLDLQPDNIGIQGLAAQLTKRCEHRA